MATLSGSAQGAAVLGSTPAEILFADLANELATTRRVLSKTPDGSFDWTPHPKSMSLGALAAHVAQLPRLAMAVMATDELDWLTVERPSTNPSTTKELLEVFDEMSAQMTKVLNEASWEDYAKEWTMRAGDQVFIRDAKHKVVRAAGISHMAHHRAQLGTYLRLLDLPVPSMYGPTADEP